MLIFIPMSGFGDRYRRAGYTEPKPLIPVDGRPMIAHVVDCFPEDARLLFAVNQVHADTTPLVDVLRTLRPKAQIEIIEPHKDGPVQTVLACAHHLPKDEPVLLNYCDFGVRWSFDAFAKWVDDGIFDGAMTAYRGFHPHSLGPTLYAYMRNEADRVLEIREKHHFTEDKFSEFASSGLYWFRRGADLVRLSEALVASGERVQNEFYVSTVTQKLIEDGGKVGVFELDRFFQWGTPQDLRDYESWAKAMRTFDPFMDDVGVVASEAHQIVPMAGRGKRFSDRGYPDPKPLIDVAGRPMIAQALRTLPRPASRVLVALDEHATDKRFTTHVAALDPPAIVHTVDHVTEGQACTAALGLEHVPLEAPVLFAPCDTGYVYDPAAWRAAEQSDADLIVWAARGHLPAIWRPQMYGWMALDEHGAVVRVAVKQIVDDVPIESQAVVTGTFWFKSAALYDEQTRAMTRDDDRVNGEFYIDTIARRMVAAGHRVRAFLVDKYIPWGTPEELDTFKYWNDVFRDGRPLR